MRIGYAGLSIQYRIFAATNIYAFIWNGLINDLLPGLIFHCDHNQYACHDLQKQFADNA